MKKVFAKPAPGRVVPLLDGKPCSEAGEWFEESRYLRRRIADGDLIEAKPPTQSKLAAPVAKDSLKD